MPIEVKGNDPLPPRFVVFRKGKNSANNNPPGTRQTLSAFVVADDDMPFGFHQDLGMFVVRSCACGPLEDLLNRYAPMEYRTQRSGMASTIGTAKAFLMNELEEEFGTDIAGDDIFSVIELTAV